MYSGPAIHLTHDAEASKDCPGRYLRNTFYPLIHYIGIISQTWILQTFAFLEKVRFLRPSLETNISSRWVPIVTNETITPI